MVACGWDGCESSQRRKYMQNWERKMLDRVRSFVETYQMLQPGGRVVAGISGGPDSVCLLYSTD